MSAPKHRKNVIVRTEPRVQPAPKHRRMAEIPAGPLPTVARVVPSTRREFSIGDLLRPIATGNPFRGGVR